MNWITENLAVGELDDMDFLPRQRTVIEQGVFLIYDVRVYFDQAEQDMIRGTMPRMSLFEFMGWLSHALWEKKVMIHCAGGIDRAPFVAVLYLVMYKEMTFEEAYAHVCSKRPQAQEHWEWVSWARERLS